MIVAKILGKFSESIGQCYLTEIVLGEYLANLPDDYHQYDVQREIVKNAYLDNLVQTIVQRKHIPPIVLVTEANDLEVKGDILRIQNFKILDGLQRTFRLNSIYKTLKLLRREIGKGSNILELSKLSISKKYKDELEQFNSSSSILLNLIDALKNELNNDVTQLESLFERKQWFEVWAQLTPDEEVSKMLILNAGHKPVKTKHQLELLFRNIIPILNKLDFPEFKLVREKEMSSINYTKERELGQFHFSHIITSVLSLGEGKPLTSNIDLIQKSQSNYFDNEILDEFLQIDFLKELVRTLLDLDKAIKEFYGIEGTRWIGRETSLVGIFAAAGRYMQERNIKPAVALQHLRDKVVGRPETLNLKDFEEKRNSLDLAKINFGNINKKAVFNGVYDILLGTETTLNWDKYFSRGEE